MGEEILTATVGGLVLVVAGIAIQRAGGRRSVKPDGERRAGADEGSASGTSGSSIRTVVPVPAPSERAST